MWIFLWGVLSLILIGSSLWSLQILLRQKKAWESYAKSKNLTFVRGSLMGNGEVSGVIGDYKLGLFTAERQGEDIRTRRLVTVVEIELIDGLVDGGAVGTTMMLPFMQSLDKLHPYKPDVIALDVGQFMFVKQDDIVKAYLTAERAEAVLALLRTKNADVLMIFNDTQAVLRLETIDPIQDADKLDKIVKRVIMLMDKLRITPEQRTAYMNLGPAPVSAPVVVPPDSDL